MPSHYVTHDGLTLRSHGQSNRSFPEVDRDHEGQQSVDKAAAAQCDHAGDANGDDEGENLARVAVVHFC